MSATDLAFMIVGAGLLIFALAWDNRHYPQVWGDDAEQDDGAQPRKNDAD